MEGKDISLKALYSIIAEEDKDSEDNNKMAERSWSWLGMPLSAIVGGIMAFAGFYYANEANQKKQEPIQTPPQIIEKNSVDYTGILTQFQANAMQILDKNNANQENILRQTQAGFAQTLEKTTEALLQVNKDSAANNENLQKQINEMREREAATKQAIDEAHVGAAEVKAIIENLKKEPKLKSEEEYGYNLPNAFTRAAQKHRLDLFTDAIADYDKVLYVEPNNALAYYNRAVARVNLACRVIPPVSTEAKNQLEMAAADYSICLKLKPDYVDALFARATVLLFREKYEDALTEYTQVINLKQHISTAYLYRGIINIICSRNNSDKQRKFYEAAITELDSAITADEQSAAAHYLRGFAKHALKSNINWAKDSDTAKVVIRLDEESNFDRVQAKKLKLDSAKDKDYGYFMSEQDLFAFIEKFKIREQ